MNAVSSARDSRGAPGGGEGLLHQRREAPDCAALQRKGLHRPARRHRLGGEGRRRRPAGPARRASGPARSRPKATIGSTITGNDEEDQPGQARARHHHHDGGADEEDEVAQRDRGARPDRRLDLRGVGGQPRDELAGAGGVEEGGGEAHQVREKVAPEVGDDALAERDDEVVARRARQREQAGKHDQGEKAAVDEGGVRAGEADVDHRADGERHRQRDERR